MKKVLIIGDSHTARLQNNLNVTFSEKCVWEHEKKIKSNCIDNHLNVLYEKEITIYFSYHKGKSAYKGYAYDNDKYPCIHQLISDEFIILPWFGYIDVKQFLPMKDKESPEIAAKRYVEQTLLFFNNNEIRFIEPMPQFINKLGTGSPNFSFEERYPLYKRFNIALNEEIKKNNLKKPISLENILKTDRLNEDKECDGCFSCDSMVGTPYKLDHPKKIYFNMILDGIIKELA